MVDFDIAVLVGAGITLLAYLSGAYNMWHAGNTRWVNAADTGKVIMYGLDEYGNKMAFVVRRADMLPIEFVVQPDQPETL